MSKFNKDKLRKRKKGNSPTELRGIILGHEEDGPDVPVFIDFKNRYSERGRENPNIFIIGELGPGKGFHIK